MATHKLKGVGGVLGGLISPEPAEVAPAPVEQPPVVTPAPVSTIAPVAEPVPLPRPRVAARKGRPPGRKSGETAVKEKVTLRLDKSLMDDYREWSWEERCQLGELVERALIQHRKGRRIKQGQ